VEELSDKTVAGVTFALCGFANVGSFAILLGGLAQIAPKRRGSIARLGVRAVLAGTLANLLDAAVAGDVRLGGEHKKPLYVSRQLRTRSGTFKPWTR
ncbi:MAG TPA: nucleoside transporter C-terminal domain-containing protein, partial [Actinomycetes bacterium]|nr:nucleoside transporter C-terminal domain-containing protein [Actinomycetes bacterium]